MSANDAELKKQRTLERRLYRLARRKGFTISKCRRRTPSRPEYGHYQIAYSATNIIVHMAGLNGYGLTLNDVAEYLKTHSAV